MKKILYYITDHGFGHSTRSIAIIRELNKTKIETIIRNTTAQNLLRSSLPNNKIITGLTDVGPTINSDGLGINLKKSKKNLKNWIEKISFFAKKESQLISKIKPNLVISDISPMPLVASKKMNVTSLAISNFSWYDVLKFIPSDELSKLLLAYDMADYAIQLPLGTKMDHFKNKVRMGLVSRKVITKRNIIRKKLGLKRSQYLVLVTIGKSNKKLNFKISDNVKILSINTRMAKSLPAIKIPNYIEGQDLVSAADSVICKCGYGIISECLTIGRPFYYVSADNHLEQKAMVYELVKKGIKNNISFDEINALNLTPSLMRTLPKISKVPLDNSRISKFIREILLK